MEHIRKVLDEIKDEFQSIGLYLIDANLATSDTEYAEALAEHGDEAPDFRDKLIAGETQWLVQAQFNIGEVAWSDRVLNPAAYAEDTEFRTIMPTEAELLAERMREAGGDPMKLWELMNGSSDDEDEADTD